MIKSIPTPDADQQRMKANVRAVMTEVVVQSLACAYAMTGGRVPRDGPAFRVMVLAELARIADSVRAGKADEPAAVLVAAVAVHRAAPISARGGIPALALTVVDARAPL